MSHARHQLQRRRNAIARLDSIMSHQRHLLIIHYSCESFYDRTDGRSPRITSIAIRNVGAGNTDSFSIHQVAERDGLELKEIPSSYDALEIRMLDEFGEYVRSHAAFQWLHWNMRDANYGFAAIEHRHRVLKGTPTLVPEDSRTELANLLIEIYGAGYVGHPRLTRLLELNRIAAPGFLSGAEEATAFEQGDYVRLHQSTLRKVDAIQNLLIRTWDGTLRTSARRRDIYGMTLGGIVESMTDHWLFKLFGAIAILASIIGAVALAF